MWFFKYILWSARDRLKCVNKYCEINYNIYKQNSHHFQEKLKCIWDETTDGKQKIERKK